MDPLYLVKVRLDIHFYLSAPTLEQAERDLDLITIAEMLNRARDVESSVISLNKVEPK